jgi:hypothetical protein
MGTYRENIAPKRVPDTGAMEATAPASRSNQELTAAQASKFRTVSLAPNPGYNVGNLVQTATNDKGTGVVGRPSSIGLRDKDWSAPANENPSGSSNQTTPTYR